MAQCVSIRINGNKRVFDYVLVSKKELKDGDIIKLVYGCDKNGVLYNEGKIIHIWGWDTKPLLEYITKKIVINEKGYGETIPISKQEREDINFISPDEVLSSEQNSIQWYAQQIVELSADIAKTYNKKDIHTQVEKMNTCKDILLDEIIAMYQKYGRIF